MDKVVDEFLSVMKSMDLDELKETTKVLDERLEGMITYKKEIDDLENKIIKRDRERFKSLRKYESKVKELADVKDKIKRLKEELVKLENKKESLKEETIKYGKISDKASREFLNAKKELKERRKLGVESTIKIKRPHKKITFDDLENKKITINGATSICKINNKFRERENNNSRRR